MGFIHIKCTLQIEGFSIDDKPEIIGTLYSTGLFYRNGSERKPRENPDVNEFGEKVKNAVSLFDAE